MPDADDEFDAGLSSEDPSSDGDDALNDTEHMPSDELSGEIVSLDLDEGPAAILDGNAESWTETESDPGQNEIEEAYQKALAVLEDAGWELDPSDSTAQPVAEVESAGGTEPPNPVEGTERSEPGRTTTPNSNGGSASAAVSTEGTVNANGPRLAVGTERQPSLDELEHSNVGPAQVIEASLFVGGTPLTSKKICALLRNSFELEFVERTIDELNDQYVAEGRPYEIRLGDGGYRLELRPEFEKLRQRAYGSGPREVKLSQEILEVLALVAYQQPISQEEVESHGKQNAGNLLRQLLRRDLVAIQRGEGGRKDVRYLTTPRFLTVFGIGSLDELPQPDDLARK